jgi:hypothetical protein
MTDGYVYCFSNESMPGILKVGMTERIPTARLADANSSDTWRPPTPYKIEFAKKVNNPKNKETLLHGLLTRYTDRVNPKREFFRVSVEEVKQFFELMDGEWWIDTPKYEDNLDDSVMAAAQMIPKEKIVLETDKKPVSKYFDQFKCPHV